MRLIDKDENVRHERLPCFSSGHLIGSVWSALDAVLLVRVRVLNLFLSSRFEFQNWKHCCLTLEKMAEGGTSKRPLEAGADQFAELRNRTNAVRVM